MQKYHIVFSFLLAFAGNFSRRIPPAACSFIVSGHMVHNITHDIQMMYKICCTKSCEMYEAHSNDIYKGGFRGAHRETPPLHLLDLFPMRFFIAILYKWA